MIIAQKILCTALLLYVLHIIDIHTVISQFMMWSKNGQTLAYLSNGFASFFFLQGLVQGTGKTSILVPVFCISSNLYIAYSYNFWQDVAVPSLIFGTFFVLSFIFFMHLINAEFEFETPFMDKLSNYTERIGSYYLAGQMLEILSMEVWTINILIRPCWTIIFTNFFVNVYSYPEQFILKSIAYQYKVKECAICLESFEICNNNNSQKNYAKKKFIQLEQQENELLKQEENIVQNDQNIQFGENCYNEKQLTMTNCYHFFHSDCLIVWLSQDKSSCPLCRNKI